MLWFCRVLDGSMRISGQSWPRSPLNCGREVGTGNETYIYMWWVTMTKLCSFLSN